MAEWTDEMPKKEKQSNGDSTNTKTDTNRKTEDKTG